MELDAEIDRLYGLPLDEFVHARDELAKRRRREGDRETADEIKALRKPTVGAWALNQAVRRRRRETKALLAAGERLRAAHDALLSGGDRAELSEAMSEEHELATALADCAEAIASEGGRSGPALKERVRTTLHAASVDDEARAELAHGRFVREREAVGLGPFGATAPQVSSRSKRASKGGGDKPTGGARKTSKAAGATGKRSRGGKRGSSGAAAAEPDAAERKEATRRAAAEREEAAARERAARLEAGMERLAEAQAALAEAEDTREAAATELESARAALREAESDARETRKAAREREREVAKRERKLERMRRATG